MGELGEFERYLHGERAPRHADSQGLRLVQRDELPEPPDFAAIAHTQGDAARQRLAQDFLRCPRVPWDQVHDVIGHGLLPGQQWGLAAASGHGKTAAVMNLTDAWVGAGHRVSVLPLEMPARDAKIYLAALRAEVDPRDALRNTISAEELVRVQHELQWQETAGAELLQFSDQRFVGIDGLAVAAAEAKAFGAEVLIVDYVQRVQAGDYQGYRRVVQALSELAISHDFAILATAQLHRGDGDPVRSFLPPSVDRIEGGKVLEQECAVVIGLYRPLVSTFTRQDAAAVRMGHRRIKDFFEPSTMGLALLKSRIRGVIGDVIRLPYERGRIRDPKTEARLAWEERHADRLGERGDAWEPEEGGSSMIHTPGGRRERQGTP